MNLPYRISHLEAPGAGLVVLGLPVAKRVQKSLQKIGFVADAASSAPGWLQLRGDVQLLAKHWQSVASAIASAPDQPHNFVSPDGRVVPLAWHTHTSKPVITHTLSDDWFDVTHLLQGESASVVEKKLSDALFAEIFAGTEGWIARAVNKKISFWLTRRLVRTKATPNQITLVNLLLGLVGCFCFLSPHYGWQITGALLLQLNSIVDGCDGEVARLKLMSSKIGGWFDTVADDILNNAMFFCLVWGVYHQTGDLFFYRFGMISVVASLSVTALIYQNLIARGKDNAAHFQLSWEKPKTGVVEQKSKSWFDRIKPVLKRDFFIFVVFVFVALRIRQYLIFFLLPVWGAFFLYLASFLYAKFILRKSRKIGQNQS